MSNVDTDTKIAASICKNFRVLASQRVNLALDDRMAPAYIMALRLAEVRAIGARTVEASIPSDLYAHVAAELLDLATIPTMDETANGFITMTSAQHYRFTW